MKKILKILLIIIPFMCSAQKQGNIWYFEGNNGIDFNSGSPVLLTNGQIPISGNIEGTATISDSLGNLLFYGTAQQIWNKNHQIMLNGSGLMGGESATQGIFIIPLPGSDSIFYVFTLDEFQNCFYYGLRYSIVKMCLDDGLGGIDNLHKNILLLDSAGEKMAATFHSNGTDIWVVVHKYFSDAFYAYLITGNGITNTVISHVGSYHPADSSTNCYEAIGQMKISPNGSKIALVNTNASSHSIEELFNFNNNTGIVSNVINLQPNLSLQYYGVSFSPDNSKLYVSQLTSNELYQYDLSSGNDSIIIASKTIIHSGNITGLQLGPDGKLYVNVHTNLDIISYPNNSGLACDYIVNGFNLFNNLAYSLPNFIDSYQYKNGIPHCKPNGIKELAINNDIYLGDAQPNPNSGSTQIPYFIPDEINNAQIIFTDMLGKIINTTELIKGYGKITVDTQNLPNGTYIYSLIIADKVYDSKKMVRTK